MRCLRPYSLADTISATTTITGISAAQRASLKETTNSKENRLAYNEHDYRWIHYTPFVDSSR